MDGSVYYLGLFINKWVKNKWVTNKWVTNKWVTNEWVTNKWVTNKWVISYRIKILGLRIWISDLIFNFHQLEMDINCAISIPAFPFTALHVYDNCKPTP